MYTVVIVDDSALFRREIILTTPWEKLNCTVVGFAEDGKPGMDIVLDHKPDIVITDIKMIQMDGIEMIKKLKQLGCKSRFIVVSAYSEFDYAVQALKMQADDYLLKPISDLSLQSSIMKSIEKINNERVLNNESFGDENIEIFYSKYKSLKNKILDNDANNYIVNGCLYIENNYQRSDLTMSNISDHLGISDSYLVKLFRTELGVTFLEYLTYVRLNYSLQKLSLITSTIYQVSEDVGYTDYRYFTRVFKKEFKMNPSDYKNKFNY